MIAIILECQKMYIETKLLNKFIAIIQNLGWVLYVEGSENSPTTICFYDVDHFAITEEREDRYLVRCDF